MYAALQVVLPGDRLTFPRIPKAFFDLKGGSMGAIHWRCFAEFYIHLVFPEIAIQSHINHTQNSQI
jgi:hypothetical protein